MTERDLKRSSEQQLYTPHSVGELQLPVTSKAQWKVREEENGTSIHSQSLVPSYRSEATTSDCLSVDHQTFIYIVSSNTTLLSRPFRPTILLSV